MSGRQIDFRRVQNKIYADTTLKPLPAAPRRLVAPRGSSFIAALSFFIFEFASLRLWAGDRTLRAPVI
ncbi:hypothetical protein CK222_27035 [Mesorhizobium sp. WSM3866]|nr:hypothetical protein CK222_27035 [Mesorhizobium sp. WSM3866]